MVFTVGAFLAGRGSGLRRGRRRGRGAGAPSRRARGGWRRAGGGGGGGSHCPWCSAPAAPARPAATAAAGAGGARSSVPPSPLPALSDTPVPSLGPRAAASFPAVSKPLSGGGDSHQASEVLKRCSTAAGDFPLSLKRTRGGLAGVTQECPARHQRLPCESSHPVQKLVMCPLRAVVVLFFFECRVVVCFFLWACWFLYWLIFGWV